MTNSPVKSITLSKKQLETLKDFFSGEYYEILYGGGTRGGKSWILGVLMAIGVAAMPGSSWLISRTKLSELQATTMGTFYEVLKELGFDKESFRDKIREKKHLAFRNGSKVFVIQVDNEPSDPEFDRLGSYSYTGAFLDEGQQMVTKVRSVLAGRFSETSGNFKFKVPKPPEGKSIDTSKIGYSLQIKVVGEAQFIPEFDTPKEEIKEVIQKGKYFCAIVDYYDLFIPYYITSQEESGNDLILNAVWKFHPCTVISCNPGKNFTYTDFYKPYIRGLAEGDQFKYLSRTTSDGTVIKRKFTQALVSDNPFVEKSYIYGLEISDDEISKQRLLYGNFEYDDDPTLLFTKNVIDGLFKELNGNDNTPYITIDAARAGKDFTVIMAWRGLDVVEIETIRSGTLVGQAEIIQTFIEKYKCPIGNVIVDEVGVGCLLPGTEVFSVNGWKKVEDIKVGDILFSKDEEGNVIYDTVWANNKFTSEQIIVDESGMAFSRGHINPIKTRNEYKYKLDFWEDAIQKQRIIFDTEFNWKGEDFVINLSETPSEMPNGGYRLYNNGFKANGIDFARFLGWFLSDGSLDNYGKVINISQKKQYNFESIEKAIINCNLHYNFVDKKCGLRKYSISNITLFNYLKKHCYKGGDGCLNFTIPQCIKKGTQEIIEAFLSTFKKGDGYTHKGTGNTYYCTSSIDLRDDLLELIYKQGKYGNYTISVKKLSKGNINGRDFTRNAHQYSVYETTERVVGLRPKEKARYFGKVYDIRLKGKTKLYPIRFTEGKMKGKMIWTHNGGLVDILGCKGFIANSTPINPISVKYLKYKRRNYANMRTQAFFYLKQYMEEEKVRVRCSDVEKEYITEELGFIRQVNIDGDTKIQLESKSNLKSFLGRSSDYSDCLSFRMFWIIKNHAEGIDDEADEITEEEKTIDDLIKELEADEKETNDFDLDIY